MMNKSKTNRVPFLNQLVAGLILLLLVAAPIGAKAQEAPDALIARISEEVFRIAKNDKEIQQGNRERILELVRNKILPYVNFERMTAMATGRFWHGATPEQQQRLTEEFRDLLIHVYSGALSQVRNKDIVIKPMRGDPASGDVEVHTEVVQPRGAEPIELNYRLAKEPSGWRIYDMSVMGVWLLQSYRSSFASAIREKGIDGLIADLAQKNQQLATSGRATATSTGGS